METVIRPETEMKDSGVQWIGDIPNDWDVRRLKYVLNERKEKNDPLVTDNILSLSAEQGVIPFSERIGGGNKPKEDLTAYKVVRAGDIVLNSMNVLSGAVHYSNYTGCVSPVYYMLYNENDVITRYYNLVFQTEAFQRSLRGLGNGILIKETDEGKLNTIRMRIPMEKLNKVKLPSPSFDEMKKVVESIEPIRSEIDEIIAEAKASIDEYKELRIAMICNAVTFGINGIHSDDVYYYNDYLPAVPKNWNIMKGKYILTPLSRDVKNDDGVVTCFRDGEVTLRSNRREKGFTNSIKETGYQGVEPGDLVVHGMDGFAGAIGISDSRGKMSPIINVLDSNQNKKYVMYYLRNLAYKDVFLGLATGIRERSCDLRWNKLADLEYLIPSKTEQQEIVEWLDEYIPKYDSLISEKESLINDLEAYKKSLIYEVVTGKRRVV